MHIHDLCEEEFMGISPEMYVRVLSVKGNLRVAKRAAILFAE